SPAFTNRLVNMSVNLSGRFGAPATEPGPCGESLDDKLMSSPFVESPAGSALADEIIATNSEAASAIAALRKSRLRFVVCITEVPGGLIGTQCEPRWRRAPVVPTPRSAHHVVRVEIDEILVRPLRPATRRCVDLVRENAHGGWNRHVRRVERTGLVFP